jgi:L-ascorbate metabolism protein UlaG (beta-lactamase superfamily)
MNITYFGHSCFQVEISGVKILFDPFITPNPLARNIDIQAILPDFILISHGHSDLGEAVNYFNADGIELILLKS